MAKTNNKILDNIDPDITNQKEALEYFWNNNEDNFELFYHDKKYDVVVQIWNDYDGSLHFHLWDKETADRLTSTMVFEADEELMSAIADMSHEELEALSESTKQSLEQKLAEELEKYGAGFYTKNVLKKIQTDPELETPEGLEQAKADLDQKMLEPERAQDYS